MTRGEAIAAIAMAAGSILLLLAILSLPLFLVHWHYRVKCRRRNALQPRYDHAIAFLRQLVESRLTEGMIIAGEVWRLPADDIMAGIFFDLLEDSARRLDTPVYFSDDGRTTTAGAAVTRLTKFRQDGLLAKACTGQYRYWTISLNFGNGESEDRVINLQEIMSAVLELRHELIQTRC